MGQIKQDICLVNNNIVDLPDSILYYGEKDA